ncbi:hypothetical protein A5701_03555 [Mycobacterium sp. E3305]|nr:hypothetical protein A5701_03555 [Mycobacterium sp. E3305]
MHAQPTQHPDDDADMIEVWLTAKDTGITCMLVRDDETTQQLSVDSRSLAGAQREITGYLIGEGYTPIGEWGLEDFTEYLDDDAIGANETMRTFKHRSQAGP